MSISRFVVQSLALPGLLNLAGCFFSSSDGPRLGTLVIDWTVEGSKDPEACAANAADRIDLVLRSWDGTVLDQFQENCEQFQTAVDLDPGDYEVDAILVDRHGDELTTSARDDVSVYSNRSSVSALDFPVSSFF